MRFLEIWLSTMRQSALVAVLFMRFHWLKHIEAQRAEGSCRSPYEILEIVKSCAGRRYNPLPFSLWDFDTKIGAIVPDIVFGSSFFRRVLVAQLLNVKYIKSNQFSAHTVRRSLRKKFVLNRPLRKMGCGNSKKCNLLQDNFYLLLKWEKFDFSSG